MSALENAVTESIAAGFNPMNGIVRTFAQTQATRGDLELDDLRLAMMGKIEEKIARLKSKDNYDEATLAAYQRMLTKYYDAL